MQIFYASVLVQIVSSLYHFKALIVSFFEIMLIQVNRRVPRQLGKIDINAAADSCSTHLLRGLQEYKQQILSMGKYFLEFTLVDKY